MSDIPTLRTRRTVLRPHRLEDFEACAAMWREPVVTRFIGGRARSREETWLRMLRHGSMWAMLGFGFWVVEDAATGEVAGEAGFHDLKRDMVPSIEGVPEAGWALRGAWHGRGLAVEIVEAITAWADAHLPAPKTVCIIDPENAASLKVAARCGYAAIGEARYGESRPTLLERARG
jgi:RimJ/RimL family protein N-acetyltransferase